uniref:Amino acid transporter transmembrane domain-containing protein n=1 Tax=Amphora coffeiformis TaxID=265554 RepID=A0A7S3P8R7_9STRA
MAGSNNSNNNNVPKSPFFRPHFAPKKVVKETISTPHGRNKLTRSVEVADDVIEHKSGVLGCAANMMTCIVGSGIVGLPFAMQQTGFVAGIFLILLTAALTEKSLRLLVETAKHLHKQSYETAAEVTFGTLGFRFILVNMFVMAYGAMVTYLMITKSCASLLLSVDDEMKQQFLLLSVSFVIQLPLACLRDMADLEKTSGLAVAIDCTIVGLVVYSAPWIELRGVSDEASNFVQLISADTVHTSSLFVGLGVLSFAFECQEAAFLVAGSLEKPTVARWGKVTSRALTACFLLAMVCAVTGYLGYGEATQGNILDNMDPASPISFVTHALLGLTMFATYPLASFVARHVCVVLLFEGPRAHEGDDASILNRPDRRILLTLVLYILAMIPATIFTDMGKVLALAGVIGGSCLAYIGPGMLYLAVHGGRFLELADNFFGPSSSASNAADAEAPVSETTSLVSPSGGDVPSESRGRKYDGCCKAFLWYITGMPLWALIAETGQKRVLAHARQLTEKNTLQNLRIGEVDLGGIEKLAKSSNGHQAQSYSPATYLRPLSERNLAAKVEIFAPPLTGGTKAPSPSVEPDPQEKPPVWLDYFVAVFYVCFGVLALFAGLISLFSAQDGA